ncbi:MAG: hypothetical protein NT122_00850 [Solirubrobacterales bacterium]|nr:hypothetical protein [Solirubrobacterales bacterium]
MLAATTTIRVTPETREALSALSAERGVTNADLVAELVTLERERGLLAAMNQQFAEMAADPVEEYRAEQRIWDSTVGDGLS